MLTQGLCSIFFNVIAIDNTTDSYIGMEHFLGWDEDTNLKVSIQMILKWIFGFASAFSVHGYFSECTGEISVIFDLKSFIAS